MRARVEWHPRSGCPNGEVRVASGYTCLPERPVEPWARVVPLSLKWSTRFPVGGIRHTGDVFADGPVSAVPSRVFTLSGSVFGGTHAHFSPKPSGEVGTLRETGQDTDFFDLAGGVQERGTDPFQSDTLPIAIDRQAQRFFKELVQAVLRNADRCCNVRRLKIAIPGPFLDQRNSLLHSAILGHGKMYLKV